ncbi:ankyrin repeat domain-containing protein 40 isoform X3 [Hypanus sabinus]|uniref:ankyrin repeat domain-containing protein 40 isoform X3 n=1 Tax=Hypanus sabinus TaxID=79690 RepID=UPI0028C4F4BF|nr:ankyrin repeat domain-containing protein 40 isoform X3 [Hypanus sabinus]
MAADPQLELDERLREACSIGDAEAVRRLLGSGARVNGRNPVNGWTCLHWACRRGHQHIVPDLLDAGADSGILTSRGESAAQLTSKPEIKAMLGELVLKVRLHNPAAERNDFIEVELDRRELTYQALLRVTCQELGIGPERVERIRKLPNTLLRKDKDVTRLQDYQELELVLLRCEGTVLSMQGALTERPCYNPGAATLIY